MRIGKLTNLALAITMAIGLVACGDGQQQNGLYGQNGNQNGWYTGQNGNYCGQNPQGCGQSPYYYGNSNNGSQYYYNQWTGPYSYGSNPFGYNSWNYYGAYNYYWQPSYSGYVRFQ